jgi:hypothetical protein
LSYIDRLTIRPHLPPGIGPKDEPDGGSKLQRRIFTALFVLCLALPHILGQAPTAFTVSGTVHDASGSVIPGAEVTIAPAAANPAQASPGSATSPAGQTAVTDVQGNFQVTL